MTRYTNLFSRLVANTHEPENDQSCWIWKGKLNPRGYGHVTMRVPDKPNPVNRLAHREMWVLVNKPACPLAYDDCVDHICETKACINPDHLRVLSRLANSYRANGVPYE